MQLGRSVCWRWCIWIQVSLSLSFLRCLPFYLWREGDMYIIWIYDTLIYFWKKDSRSTLHRCFKSVMSFSASFYEMTGVPDLIISTVYLLGQDLMRLHCSVQIIQMKCFHQEYSAEYSYSFKPITTRNHLIDACHPTTRWIIFGIKYVDFLLMLVVIDVDATSRNYPRQYR